MRKQTNHHQTRGGYTLLEVLLALAVIVSLLTVVWPSVTRMFQDYQIKSVANDVRVQVAGIRTLSLNQGVSYQFRYEPEGTYFVAVPSEYGALTITDDTASTKANRIYGVLPEGMQFRHADGVTELNTEKISEIWLEGMENSTTLSGKDWSAPLYFHPDGTASEGEFQVVSRDGIALSISVRGLTGAVKMSAIKAHNDNPYAGL